MARQNLRIKFLILIVSCSTSFVNNWAIADDSSNRIVLIGKISNVELIDTVRKPNSEQQIDLMGQMFGALGFLVASVLSVEQRAYNIYVVNNEVKTVTIESRSSFSVGDCVSINYPSDLGDTPYIEVDVDASINISSECSSEQTQTTSLSN